MRSSLPPAEVATMIRSSKAVAALTGAGISTAAGIPDFRGPQGLYVTRRYDPEKVFDIRWFYREPLHFYEFARDFADLAERLLPTYSHRFLQDLCAAGRMPAVITQNIDLLHQAAGSERVIELHGSFGSATCLDCGRIFGKLNYEWWRQAMQNSRTNPIARCGRCDGVLKPNIVFFGEPVLQYEEAEALVARCDLLLVLGSSLNVAPASLLPYATDAPTVVINQGPVALGSAPHRFVVDAELDSYLQDVAALL